MDHRLTQFHLLLDHMNPDSRSNRCVPLKATQPPSPYAFRAFSFTELNPYNCHCQNPLQCADYQISATISHLYLICVIDSGTSDGSTVSPHTWSYNLALQKWRKLPDDNHVEQTATIRQSVNLLTTGGDNAQAAVNGSRSIWYNGDLYSIGGFPTAFRNRMRVNRYNMGSLLWEDLTGVFHEAILNRMYHELVCDGKHVFVLGGCSANNVALYLKHIPVVDLSTKKWLFMNSKLDRSTEHTNFGAPRELPGYPSSRRNFSSVQHTLANGDVEAIIVGGFLPLNGRRGNIYFNDVWTLNCRTLQWRDMLTARTPRPFNYHAATIDEENDCMYVYGGNLRGDRQRGRRQTILKMWLSIPKLSEICWDAMTHYFGPQMGEAATKDLRAIGIPKRFIERLNAE